MAISAVCWLMSGAAAQERALSSPGRAASGPRWEMAAGLGAPGPHPSLGDQAHLFDRFVGTWDCDYAEFAADGSVRRSAGEVIFGWIMDGRALQDIWITSPHDGAKEREIGTTVRYYDTAAKQWRVVWIDPGAGKIAILTGGAVGDRIVLGNQDKDGGQRRWSFNNIQSDSFVWRSEKSRDGGKTWRMDAEYHLKRRNNAAPAPAEVRISAVPDRRRDMITALPAPQPHASLGGQARTFDRLVGAWDCDYTFFLEDGSLRHKSGELRFGWIIDGWAMQDTWVSDPSGGSKERTMGTSIRFFDRQRNAWRVVFVNPQFNVLMNVEGGAEGDRIVLHGVDTDGSPLRWSFNDIKPDSFVWRGEKSDDGGKTWRLEEEHHMRRRTGSSKGGGQ